MSRGIKKNIQGISLYPVGNQKPVHSKQKYKQERAKQTILSILRHRAIPTEPFLYFFVFHCPNQCMLIFCVFTSFFFFFVCVLQ
ncbi:hypothetical protein BDV36DRAFT_260167, partial [Aspergillus pseudocaelatus]